MKIEKVIVSAYATNCYIVTIDAASIIIDPGDDAEEIIAACEGKNIVDILVTHHHDDHIGALKAIEDYYNIKASEYVKGFNFEIIKTPGHTSDSISFYFPEEKVLFSGDFLFYRSIGRTDLPTASNEDMIKSLQLIETYPDDITVYPGHGKSTILGNEKEYFPEYYEYLK